MLIGPSILELANNRGAGVVLLDASGDPIFGFDQSRPATATLSNVATSTTSAVLAAANAARRGLYIYNDHNKDMYVAFAPTASLTAFTFIVPSKDGAELPLNGYTGVISAVVKAGTGDARVTELTA